MKDKMFLPACIIAIFAGSFIGGAVSSAIIKIQENKKAKKALNKNIKVMTKVLEESEEA